MIPKITDQDIDWVCSFMGLDPFDEPRRAFLKDRATVDVSACPGSGKTTLVVAKLAILAKKWPHRTRGICVLSHTNVAREQIEHRLGGTVVGQRLLAYPHFIDTMHGFVNRFFALPWLNSNGYPSPIIDDDVTTAYRRRVLGNADYWTVQSLLKRKYSGFDRLRICTRDLDFNLGDRDFPAGPLSKSFGHAKRAVEASAQAGYFCHDEMFVWAKALLEDQEDVTDWIGHRFPLVIVDEMQDTFDLQTSFLNAIFPRSSNSVVVQRVGDPNQGIFEDLGVGGAEDTAPYPDSERFIEIPNSYRFGSHVAALASPLAVDPVGTDGLCGIGPKGPGASLDQRRPAIFVFPDGQTDGVLDAYGRYLLSELDGELLDRGLVAAVGHVHKDDTSVAPGHPHYPKTVGHYWAGYQAEISLKDAHPPTLAQYFLLAQGLVVSGKGLSAGVEKIASGVRELARRLGDSTRLKRKPRTHRFIVEVLESVPDTLAQYRRLLRRLLVDGAQLTKDEWDSYRELTVDAASELCDGEADTGKARSFLEWSEDRPSRTTAVAYSSTTNAPGPNVYRATEGDRSVDIRLGSIHSVKGQTHLATLLMSTFWHQHSARWMMPWLVGDKVNGQGAGVRDLQRLRHCYVAMTRPSHLLCLAVPCSALGRATAACDNVEAIMNRGWRVAKIVDGTAQWLN